MHILEILKIVDSHLSLIIHLVKEEAASQSRPHCGLFCAKLSENVTLAGRDNPSCDTDDYTLADIKASIQCLGFLTCLHTSPRSLRQSRQSFLDHYEMTFNTPFGLGSCTLGCADYVIHSWVWSVPAVARPAVDASLLFLCNLTNTWLMV